ncbi:hypothetical protein J635_0284 [Acinetobacter baumannii 233846]|nr:hypothetical protein J635_0284 [Acinetobacter baumannii 233846]
MHDDLHLHTLRVHGGIRHLESIIWIVNSNIKVHGGIRHLEIMDANVDWAYSVHGGIRHLEIRPMANLKK